MGYAKNFIKTYGEECTIKRTTDKTSYVSIKPATQSFSDNRDLYREGLILAGSALSSGEVMTVGNETLLIRSTYRDKQSGEISFVASKANAALVHKRLTETVDGWGNVTREWQTITETVPATAQATTAALLEKEPGLLPNTKWIFVVPAIAVLEKLDRLEFANGTKCQVEDIDPLRLEGLLYVQCSDDLRSGADYVEPPPKPPEEGDV